MPRPLIASGSKSDAFTIKLDRKSSARSNKLSEQRLSSLLSKRRSKEYIQAIVDLDLGEHIKTQEAVQKVLNAIRVEFPEVTLEDELVGYVAKCYLGEPYEVHTLDMNGEIITHYKQGESLPPELEKGRKLTQNNDYKFVEVYHHMCCAIDAQGNSAVIKQM